MKEKLEKSYTVEGQLDVACVQRGGSLVRADYRAKVFKAGVDFYKEAFVLEAHYRRTRSVK